MLVDIVISLVLAFIIISIATLFVIWVIKTQVGKMVVVAVAAMLILFSIALASGHAEEDIIVLVGYRVETGYFEGEPALFVQYTWKGETHAFVWDELVIETGKPIWIKLTDEGTCYDAGYCIGAAIRQSPFFILQRSSDQKFIRRNLT